MKRHWSLVTGYWLMVGLCLLLPGPWSLAVKADGPNASLEQQVSQGQQVYEERCAACHGIDGGGQGPGAEQLFVKPRDFTRDEYKIKSTEGDEFPSREDLIRVISKGMPGSSMPAWESVLSQGEIGAVTDYIQTLGRFFPQEGYGTTIIDVPSRVDPSAESIARGQALYESDIECAKCHGQAGRGDGPSAFELTDNAGHVIYPADLTQPWQFRGGAEPEQIYLRLRTGLTGSPMPSFADALSSEETWDLVNYILSLSPESLPEPAVLLVSHFVTGSLPDDPNDPAWTDLEPAYYPLTSQLMRAPRHYQLAINGMMVKSLYNDSEIAFHVAWNDRTETSAEEVVDAMAIQFPQEFTDDSERPYFVFGDSQRAVYQWYWAADKNTMAERNATGLNAVEVQPEGQQQTKITAQYQAGRWQLVLRRTLQTSDNNDLAFAADRFIPLSFMAWDGFADEAENRLGLTGWSIVYLQSPTPVTQYAWIPGVMVAVLAVELAIMGLVRRTVRVEGEA